MYLLTDLRSEGVVMVMRLFESMLRSTGNNGVELIKSALPNIFKYVKINFIIKSAIFLKKNFAVIFSLPIGPNDN